VRRTGIITFVLILFVGLAMAWETVSAREEHLLQDIDGVVHGVLERMAQGTWTVLFFVMTDCPISNQYAPEIQRICTEYGAKGARCFLVYVDPSTTAAAIKKHQKDYAYTCCSAILDSDHKLVRKAGATVSSEVAVFSSAGELQYHGRIDNFYAGLGAPRQRITQHDLRDALDALNAGRRVSNPRTQAFGCFIE
jgi:hypothetical protein